MAELKENYQTMRTELDDVLQALQTDELDIDETTKLYERGVQLIDKLEKYLKSAENKITKIKADFDRKKD